MIPSIGITSPARTRMMSPTATSSIGMSAIDDPCRRCAIRGARSINDFRSRSARATAKSSSTLPPAYMTATTTPARFSPSASAADIETNAIASTPMRPARKSRIMETSRPTTTGAVPAAQIQFANSPRPMPQASRPRISPPSAVTIRALRRKRSVKNCRHARCSAETGVACVGPTRALGYHDATCVAGALFPTCHRCRHVHNMRRRVLAPNPLCYFAANQRFVSRALWRPTWLGQMSWRCIRSAMTKR